MAASDKSTRWAELDGLRACAVAVVSLFHLFVVTVPSWNPLRPAGGFLGVDIFYVLSGFLISTILLAERDKTGRLSIAAFYSRRVLRLFPALAVMLVCVVVAAAIIPDQPWGQPTLLALPWVVLYVGNWNAAFFPQRMPLGALGHTWSLAVEEQFYLLWPVILGFVLRRFKNRSRVALVLLLVALVEMLYRYLALTHFGFGFLRVFYGTDTASDGLLLGCALAFYLDGRGWRPFTPKVRKALNLMTVAAAAGLTLMIMRLSFLSERSISLGISGAVICTSIIVLNLVTKPLPPLRWILASRPFVWVGRRSYGIYLWVTPMIFLVQPLGTHDLGLYPYTGLVLLAAMVAAAVSYRIVELPFLRKKIRFERVRLVPQAASSAPPTELLVARSDGPHRE